MSMKEVRINSKYILREDGRLFKIKTGEEYIPALRDNRRCIVKVNGVQYTLHSLVMLHFGPPCPGPEYEIVHKSENLMNNSIDNLEWKTHSEACKIRHTTKNERHAAWQKANREFLREYQYQYNENNREKINEYSRNSYIRNKENKIKINSDYQKEHKEEVNKNHRKWNREHKEYNRERDKKYLKEHPEKQQYKTLIRKMKRKHLI